MPTNRKVWKIKKPGIISRFALVEEPLPLLSDSKIRIQTKAIGLNFADIFSLVGLYSATPKGSFIPGLEFSGIVSEVGSSVNGFCVGDSVMGVTRFGGYSSMIDIEPLYCQPLPQGWTYSEGAAYPVQTLTAWYALKTLGDVKPNQTVLIQSAAGGVGLQAMRICQKLGIYAIGTVSKISKKEFLQQQGFDQVIVRDGHFRDSVKKMLGKRELNLVLDAIGGKIQRECYELLAPTGRLIVFGSAQYTPGRNRPRYLSMIWKFLHRPLYDPLDLISDNKSIMGFNLIWLWDRVELLLSLMEELRQMNLPSPHVGREFPFEKAHDAIEFLRSGESIGKIVLQV